MATAKVRLISIGYTTVFDDCDLDLYIWQEFDTPKKAIDFINKKHGGPSQCLTREQNLQLHNERNVKIGGEHYFILYPHEQNKWVKTLVGELL